MCVSRVLGECAGAVHVGERDVGQHGVVCRAGEQRRLQRLDRRHGVLHQCPCVSTCKVCVWV